MTERFVVEAPRAELADSYRALVREFTDRREPLVPFTLEFPHDDFGALLRQLAAFARGEGLPAGFVPHTTLWLVADGKEVLGVSNLRHILTPRLQVEGGNIGYGVRPSARRQGHATRLLRGTLEHARGLGLDSVLLTCAKDNAASVATIRKCGGVFDSEEFIASRNEIVQRYWIDLA